MCLFRAAGRATESRGRTTTGTSTSSSLTLPWTWWTNTWSSRTCLSCSPLDPVLIILPDLQHCLEIQFVNTRSIQIHVLKRKQIRFAEHGVPFGVRLEQFWPKNDRNSLFGYDGWSICIWIGIKMESQLLIHIKTYETKIETFYKSMYPALSVLFLKSFLAVISRTRDGWLSR